VLTASIFSLSIKHTYIRDIYVHNLVEGLQTCIIFLLQASGSLASSFFHLQHKNRVWPLFTFRQHPFSRALVPEGAPHKIGIYFQKTQTPRSGTNCDDDPNFSSRGNGSARVSLPTLRKIVPSHIELSPEDIRRFDRCFFADLIDFVASLMLARCRYYVRSRHGEGAKRGRRQLAANVILHLSAT
jgi:hypothetical protein